MSRPGILFSPVLFGLMIDLRDLLCVAAHEEERDAEQGGNGQHHYRETWDALQTESNPLHDDATDQHPHSHSWQIHSTWEK